MLLGAAAVLGVSAAQAHEVGGTPLAFVTVQKGSEVVGVDLDAGRVVARIRVPRGPSSIASSNDLRLLLVASPQSGKVTLVDAIRRHVVKVFSGFGRPTGVAFGPGMDSRGRSWYAYVVDEKRGQLVVIDLRRLTVVGRVAVGRSPLTAIVGDLIWITHAAEPVVTALALDTPASPKVVDRVPVHLPVVAAAPEADSITLGLVYASGQIAAVDTGTHLLLWHRALSAPAYSLAAEFLNERAMWVTTPRSGRTALIAARGGRIVRTLDGCPGAHGVEPVGSAWIVVACHGSRSVAVYNARTWQKTTVSVGAAPEAVAPIVGP